MAFLETVKTTMKFSFQSHIIIHAKLKPSFKTMMRVVGIMSSKSIDFKWLPVAYMALLYIATLQGIFN